MMFHTAILQTLTSALHKCAKRFPAPLSFVTALALFLIYLILVEPGYDILNSTLGYFLGVGALLSLTLALWVEEVEEDKKTNNIQTGAYALLLADTIYLYSIDFGKGQSTETFLMHASILFALALSVLLLSFRKETNDTAAWNFALRLLLNLVACGGIGLLLWGGLSLLLVSLKWLFSVNLGWKWYTISGVLFSLYLPALLFLGRIPDGEEKHDTTPLRSAFLGNVMRYIFVPLEGLYVLVLLAYAIRILVQWELPNGYVSWLVIASMAGCIAIEIGLYPIRLSEKRSIDDKIARLLPLVLTPLLLLMTVGIIRRFIDYGVTIPRLYLILLNLWFYAVCLGLYLTRARRIHWVGLSFAALFLLTSALPVNFSNFTRRHLLREVRQLIGPTGASLPLTADAYDRLMQSMPEEQAASISSKLHYIELQFSKESISSVVDEKERSISFETYAKQTNSAQDISYIYGEATTVAIDIPQGFTRLEERHFNIDISKDQKQAVVPVARDNGDFADTLVVDISRLKSYSKVMNHPIQYRSKHGTCIYAMTNFNASLPGSLYINGYLFTK